MLGAARRAPKRGAASRPRPLTQERLGAHRVAKLVSRPVVVGIILGLGLGFMLDGINMMAADWLIAGVGFSGTLLLLTNRTVPAMFLLLLFGVATGIAQNPDVLKELSALPVEFRLQVSRSQC